LQPRVQAITATGAAKHSLERKSKVEDNQKDLFKKLFLSPLDTASYRYLRWGSEAGPARKMPRRRKLLEIAADWVSEQFTVTSPIPARECR